MDWYQLIVFTENQNGPDSHLIDCNRNILQFWYRQPVHHPAVEDQSPDFRVGNLINEVIGCFRMVDTYLSKKSNHCYDSRRVFIEVAHHVPPNASACQETISRMITKSIR